MACLVETKTANPAAVVILAGKDLQVARRASNVLRCNGIGSDQWMVMAEMMSSFSLLLVLHHLFVANECSNFDGNVYCYMGFMKRCLVQKNMLCSRIESKWWRSF